MKSALPGVVSGVFRQFQTCARLNNLEHNWLMTGSDHVETERTGWLLIRDSDCLFCLLRVSTCGCGYAAGVGRKTFVLMSQWGSQQQWLQIALLFFHGVDGSLQGHLVKTGFDSRSSLLRWHLLYCLHVCACDQDISLWEMNVNSRFSAVHDCV